MSVTLDVSSDIIGGVLGVALAAVVHAVSVYVFPRLLGKSQLDAVLCGERIEASVRSMARIRNRLGLWTWLLMVLVQLLSLSLEFGLKGVTVSIENEQPAVVLGGGPRYSEPGISGENVSSSNEFSDIFAYDLVDLPELFSAAVKSCFSATVETENDYVMLKNYYPVIGVDSSQTSSDTFEVFECTSSWLGSSEWTTAPAGNLTIRTDTLTEQVRYENVRWGWDGVPPWISVAEVLSISYGLGTSYLGDEAPVVVVHGNTVSDEIDPFAISITEDGDHYVYSTSTSLETVSTSGIEVITGPFNAGHIRSSSYSLGGIIAFMLQNRGGMESVVDVFESSEIWWLSHQVDSGSLEYNNVEGAEESWPGLQDFLEYKKPTQLAQYPFTAGQREATLIRSWFFPLAGILGILFVMSLLVSKLHGKQGGFWTYDGFSRMIRDPQNPSALSVVGQVGSESKAIGFVRSEASPVTCMYSL